MISETHIPVPDVRLLREILDRMRHDGCGGSAGKAELITGIEGVSSRPVRNSCCGRAGAPSRVRPDPSQEAH